MKKILSDNKPFIIPYLVLLFISIIILIHYTKAEIHLYINQFHSSFFDVFFKYITILGDGISLPVFALIMLMMRYRYAILMVMVFLIAGLFVQILKRFFFADVVRPVEYFKNIAELYLIPGEKMNLWHSFPSGHSATAFGYTVCLLLVFKNNYLKLSFFLLGVTIAFSRMYLSQHFFIDIITGSFIGTTVSIICFWWINRWKSPWLDKNILNKKEKINYNLYD